MVEQAHDGPHVGGHCDSRFAAVRGTFVENFLEHDEIGGAVAVMLGGRVVVDLYGGHAPVGAIDPGLVLG